MSGEQRAGPASDAADDSDEWRTDPEGLSEGESGEGSVEYFDEDGDEPRTRHPIEQDDSVVRFAGHSDSVYAVRFGPGNLAVSGGGDDRAFLWDTATGQTVHELRGHQDSVASVAFSAEGKFVATGSLDAVVKVWDVASGQEIITLEGPSESIEWLEWHPKGPALLAGAGDGSMWLWMLPAGTCMNVYAGHSAQVTCGRFFSDGKRIVSGSEDGTVRLWDAKTAAVQGVLQGSGFHEGPVTCVTVAADAPLLLSGSQDNTARLVHIDQLKTLQTLQHDESVEDVAFCRAMPFFVTACVDGKLRVFDQNTGQQRTACAHGDALTRVRVMGDSPLVLSASLDRLLRLWDVRSGTCVRTWQGHADAILDFDLSADGKHVVTASDDDSCAVFALS